MNMLDLKSHFSIRLFMKQFLKCPIAQNALAPLLRIDFHHGVRKVSIEHDGFFVADGAAIDQRVIGALGFVDIALGVQDGNLNCGRLTGRQKYDR